MDLQPLESGNAVLQTVQSSEGGRAFKLLQERQRRLKGLEAAKTEIEKETQRRRLCHIDEKYTGSTSEALEAAFREETVGLVTAEEFRAKRLRLLQKLEDELAAAQVVATKPCATGDRVGSVKRHQVQKSKLSFVEAEDDEDNEESEPLAQPVLQDKVQKAIKKDPTVDTSFLSDVEREEKLREEKEKIIREYYEEQERIKREPLEITYSYWDGLGHRRTVQVQKGTTVGQFLSECRKSLEKDFPELRSVATDNLMYIKEDLILPHRVTFYELIKNKARGKSGPLFKFDVHDDVRMYSDVRVEKDETHAGKIVERKWYERNKHIFPASRWEQYDPNRTYEKYTIHGDKDYSTTVV